MHLTVRGVAKLSKDAFEAGRRRADVKDQCMASLRARAIEQGNLDSFFGGEACNETSARAALGSDISSWVFRSPNVSRRDET
jgi:hypothetical protein